MVANSTFSVGDLKFKKAEALPLTTRLGSGQNSAFHLIISNNPRLDSLAFKSFADMSLNQATTIHVMMAHFSQYLSNNDPPSEDDAHGIKVLREFFLEELAAINVEIERVENIWNSTLKLKRANIQKSLDEYNTILSPVRRLPMDVWGVIFVYCLATYRTSIMNASEAPILLTHVCRDWRSIALSTPQIWTKLYIHLRWQGANLDECQMKTYSKEVQKWLQLSAACPLSISILPPTYNCIYFQPLLDVIIQSSRRWQKLELGSVGWSSGLFKKMCSLSADDLPMLRELRLGSTVLSQEADRDFCYQSGLATTRGLRTISIERMNKLPTNGVPANWKRLNRLFIYSLVPTSLASQILSHCSNLVACLFGVRRDSHDSNTLTPSFLPRLEFLSLQGDPESRNKLFSSIQAPSLRILDSCWAVSIRQNEGVGLFAFLRGIKALKTLMIDHRDLIGVNGLTCCDLFPSLTHLVLGRASEVLQTSWYNERPHPHQTDSIAMLYGIKQQLCANFTPIVVFPSLEIFEAFGFPSVTDEMLLRFITARIDASVRDSRVSKLKKVVFKISRSRKVDIIPRALAHARAAGLNLELELTYNERPDLCMRQWFSSPYG